MMISTRGRYALRVMIDLAEHQSEGYIPLKEIAEREEISEKYLESILKALVKGGILIGLRGKGGGYRLNQPPEQCTVGSILRLTEGSLAPVNCLEKKPVQCERAGECRTLPMWQKLDTLINEFFDGITVADLARPDEAGNDFVI
ncbi:MAG: RrF2 family transcriptional regulator [Butyricicoccus sp.]